MYKKLKNKKLQLIFGVILLITLNFTFISCLFSPVSKSTDSFKELKSSGVYYDVIIDDLPISLTNWNWAMTQPWFGGGSGTSGDPYVIEDHIFEYSAGSGLSFGIYNSRKHFIINNCTFRDSSLGSVTLLLDNVAYGQILNCYIYNSDTDGIHLLNTNEMLISNNEIYDNDWSGIFMDGICENNTITGNLFDNNGLLGTEIAWGCSNNLFYNNRFINPNSGHAYDDGSNNWNNTVIGNYWDDYSEYDMDLDGFGDIPYSIPGIGGAIDYLPIWDLQGPILIDDSLTGPGAHNWTWAESQPWCSGSGTELDPYSIENLKINGNGILDGITIKNSNVSFIIHGCLIYYCDMGIYLYNVNNSRLIENNCSNNNNGIFVTQDCNNNMILGNIVNGNDYVGITIYSNCNNNTILENTANNNVDSGIYITFLCTNNNVSRNTANNNGNFGIYLTDICTNNTILENFTSKNDDYGIFIYSSDYNFISGNFLNENNVGMDVEISNKNNIVGNTVNNNNNTGIRIDTCNTNNISRNYANNNDNYGIYLNECEDSEITKNIVNENGENGIHLNFQCRNNTISRNTLNKNDNSGIYLEANNDYNTVSGNIICDHNVSGISNEATNNNTFYGNFFLENRIHAVDNGTDNRWNSTTIGNYWDNWTSPDVSPVDGIVDFPYKISGLAGSKDYLPIAEDGPPLIIINSPSEDDLFGTSAPSFSVTIADDYLDETWYTLDGGLQNITFTGSTDTIDQSAWDSAPDGKITLRMYASDLPGNIGTAVVNIEKDSQAPTITITSPIVGAIFGASAPSFVVDITDANLDSMWYSLDGGTTIFTFTNSNGIIDQTAWAALAEGPITITFYANDTVGNVGSESIDIIKNLPPPGDDFIIIIIITSLVVGAAGVAAVTVVVLRKRKGVE